ncbi:MAG: hypothetical protein Q9192_007052, partial [Flavoplaca navasiana]
MDPCNVTEAEDDWEYAYLIDMMHKKLAPELVNKIQNLTLEALTDEHHNFPLTLIQATSHIIPRDLNSFASRNP